MATEKPLNLFLILDVLELSDSICLEVMYHLANKKRSSFFLAYLQLSSLKLKKLCEFRK